MKNCPSCGKLNDDDWPVEIDGIIEDGGCQTCWKNEVDDCWWAIQEFLKTTRHPLAFIMLSIRITMEICQIERLEHNTLTRQDKPEQNIDGRV